MWLGAYVFLEIVKNFWFSYQIMRTPNFILVNKIKTLKFDSKKWNIKVFANIDNKKIFILEELHVLEVGEGNGILTKDILLRNKEVMIELERILLREKISWRQNLRAL